METAAKTASESVPKLKHIVPDDLKDLANVDEAVLDFVMTFQPAEAAEIFPVYVDAHTNARYCECHIPAEKLIELGTIDVPLDPDEQGEYRANRDLVVSHVAFEKMKEDAKARRTFSNIVAEFTKDFDEEHPLKIIGGQHRFVAIREALSSGINEYQGVKVYFSLTSSQRLDVQLVSNTVIGVSTDLYDRMQETVRGPELRNWCQGVGLLEKNQDFADKKQRGSALTVRAARTFIVNYFRGVSLATKDYKKTETIPTICKSGKPDSDWEKLRSRKPPIWKDLGLLQAGKEFAKLVTAQREAFGPGKAIKEKNADFEEKALSYAVLAAWSFIAGVLRDNDVRSKRHYALSQQKSHDPLNAGILVAARHKSDATNYRGLGTRTSPKDLGRLAELFYIQAEKGKGINKADVDLALKSFHAKEAALDLEKALDDVE